MRAFLLASLLALLPLANAQQPLGTISTVAGGGIGDGGPATNATLHAPAGVATGPGGVIYVADTNQGRVRRIAPDGTITTVYAGSRRILNSYFPIFYSETPASCPTDIVVDSSGNLLFSDPCAHVIRKIDTAGVVSVYAGRGYHETPVDPPMDGPALSASLYFPKYLALDAAGNLYISEPGRNRIRKVDTAGAMSSVLSGTYSDPSPGPIAVDSGGVLYAYITGPGTSVSNRIQRYVNGSPTLVAGTGATANSGDGGAATLAGLASVSGMGFDAAGNLMLAMADRIRRITPGGVIDTVATVGAVDVVPDGTNYLVASGDRVLRLTAAGASTPVAGIAGTLPLRDGGPATAAHLESPRAITADATGAVFIAEYFDHRIRRVDANGVITTFAGTGSAGFAGDGGQASAAQFSNPASLAFDGAGNLYVADRANHRIRRIDSSGLITTIAGTGTPGFSGDGGPAAAAQLWHPSSIAFDDAGNMLIADADNRRVRRITPAGVISTFAGGGHVMSWKGMPLTPATSITFLPKVVRFHQGAVFVQEWSDQYSMRVIRIGIDGYVTGVLADQTDGFSTNALPASQPFKSMSDLEIGPQGQLIISDTINDRVVQRTGTSGLFSTVAGGATCSGSCPAHGIGDGGPAAESILNSSYGLHFHPASGNLYISDEVSDRVRSVRMADPMPASFSIPAATNAALGSQVTSAAVTPAGYVGTTSVSVSAGAEYSVGCTGTFTSAPGTLSPGQNVCVRQAASPINNATTAATLTVGGRSAAFQVTTVVGPGSSTISATSFDFGGQSINTSSFDRTVSVTNSGSNAITLNAVIATVGLTVTHDCATLAVGATCPITVRFTPAVEGAYNGTVTLQLSSGSQSFTVTGIGERSLATHYYRAILGRDPEPAGKAFWNGEAARAATLGANPNEAWYAMAATFFSSPEYRGFNRTDSEFLGDLYNTFFNRAPDSGGLAYWQTQLDAGLPREMLVTSFTFSSEFTNFTRDIFGTTSVRPEVDLVMDLYRGYLARLPDDAGFAHWVGRMRAIQCSGFGTRLDQMRAEVESMISGFIQSAEYVARNRNNAQYLADTYAALFRRGADVAGFNFWLGQVAGGSSREAVRGLMITYSPEFQSRIGTAAFATCLG